MLVMIVGLVVFLGVHSLRIFADGWRTAQIARLGGNAWRGLYSLVSLAGFGLIVWGFSIARQTPVFVWLPPVFMRHIAAPLVLISFILITAAYVPGNGIKARIGHPMLAGTKVWAFAHLLANGTLNDMILFGAFLVWAIALFVVSRRRDRAAGVTYPRLGTGRTALTVVIGAIAWLLFALFGHRMLIGVNPFV
ncbi:MAG: NnrU family protein [Burkholderiaceae bacterium]|nr:NnrU family protein [Burkholderiaceae bacterium]